MSTPQFTPGPWRYIARDPDCSIPFGIEFVSGRSSVLPIADVCNNPIPEEREANARLIASAPDLVAALQTIARHGPIMGSTGEYREGQIHALEATQRIALKALSAALGE